VTALTNPAGKVEISAIAQSQGLINLFFQYLPVQSPSSSELLNVQASRDQEALTKHSLSAPPVFLIPLYYNSLAAITRKQKAAKGQLLKSIPSVN